MADAALSSPEVKAMLDLLLARIQGVLGAKLAGLYVVGSLVTGDFDFRSSDLDLIAVLADDPSDADVQALGAMHVEIAQEKPFWDDRIEVLYVTRARLQGDQTDYTFPITSPGEPFHIRDVHHEHWYTNWHSLREISVLLYGADPKTFVAPIPHEALVRVVRDLSRMTQDWLDADATLGAQAYAILTLCRALRLIRMGESVSKQQAAAWAAAQFPQWADLLERALVWRAAGKDQLPGHAEQYPQTKRFIEFMIEQIDSEE